MTLQEARQKISDKYGKDIYLHDSIYGNEAIELFRAHWEAVGVKKGMEQAREIIAHQITYNDTENVIPDKDGIWIDKYDLYTDVNAGIEKLSN